MSTKGRTQREAVALFRIYREALETAGLRQQDVIESTGLSPTNLSEMVHGKRKLGIRAALLIQRAIGAPGLADQLLYAQLREDLLTTVRKMQADGELPPPPRPRQETPHAYVEPVRTSRRRTP